MAAAELHERALETVIRDPSSPTWQAAALARQGTLYDEVWAALRSADPPRITLFTETQSALLSRLRQSNVGLRNQAADLREAVAAGWQRSKSAKLVQVGQKAVSLYACAVELARAKGVSNAEIAHARARLAVFTSILGDAVMGEYVGLAPDRTDASGRRSLTYTAGMYR